MQDEVCLGNQDEEYLRDIVLTRGVAGKNVRPDMKKLGKVFGLEEAAEIDREIKKRCLYGLTEDGRGKMILGKSCESREVADLIRHVATKDQGYAVALKQLRGLDEANQTVLAFVCGNTIEFSDGLTMQRTKSGNKYKQPGAKEALDSDTKEVMNSGKKEVLNSGEVANYETIRCSKEMPGMLGPERVWQEYYGSLSTKADAEGVLDLIESGFKAEQKNAADEGMQPA